MQSVIMGTNPSGKLVAIQVKVNAYGSVFTASRAQGSYGHDHNAISSTVGWRSRRDHADK